MDGLEFERFVAERMEGFGWEARCTPGSSDYGADVICTLGSEKLVIQCKCYSSSNSVGGDAVREAYTAMAHFKADHGTVVYRGRPSRQARNLSGTTGVGLYHVDELIEGWAFDRTKEGEKARRLAELKRREEQERQRADDERNYHADVAKFQSSEVEWLRASRKHEQWMVGGGIALVLSLASFSPPAVGISLALAGYAFLGTSPGQRPYPPGRPQHMPNGTAKELPHESVRNIPSASSGPWSQEEAAARQAAAALWSTGQMAQLTNGVWKIRSRDGNSRILSHAGLVEFSKGKSIVRCRECTAALRLPAFKKLKVLCPKCGSSSVYET